MTAKKDQEPTPRLAFEDESAGGADACDAELGVAACHLAGQGGDDAVKLYEMGRLSSGAAAGLANVPKPLFLTKLADYGVDTFDISEEELLRDLASAQKKAVVSG